MTYSRRDLTLLLPALIAAQAGAVDSVLPSRCYPFDSLPLKTDPKTHIESRQVFKGETHAGVPIDMHITTLGPGQMPHPPHQHVHEELMMIQQGKLEFTIMGKSTTVGAGSVAYVHSNELHGLKNVGDSPAQYFVLAIGREKNS